MSTTLFSQGLRSEEAVQAFVRKCGDGCAFLRHNRTAIRRRETSDWDIAVRDPRHVGIVAEGLFGPPIVKIERQYVIQRFYPWGQLDLLPGFLCNGVRFLDKTDFWAGVQMLDDGIPRPKLAHDAFLAWFTGVLTGGIYSKRYHEFVASAVEHDGQSLRKVLAKSFGRSWGNILWQWASDGEEEKAAEFRDELRRAAAFRHGCDEPGGLAWSVVSHWFCELRHHYRPTMPLIAFLGPDGSGKSSVIERVQQHLEAMRIKTKLLHWRPHSFSNKQAGGSPVIDPHGEPPRGLLASFAKLGLFLLDWWAACLGPLLHVRAKVTTVLSDRYYNDLLVDQRRYRYGAPTWIAKWVFKLMPRPDRVIVLVGDPKVIYARKQEVTMEELVRQTDAYRELGQSLGEEAVIIDSAAELDSVVEDTINAIHQTFKERAKR